MPQDPAGTEALIGKIMSAGSPAEAVQMLEDSGYEIVSIAAAKPEDMGPKDDAEPKPPAPPKKEDDESDDDDGYKAGGGFGGLRETMAKKFGK